LALVDDDLVAFENMVGFRGGEVKTISVREPKNGVAEDEFAVRTEWNIVWPYELAQPEKGVEASKKNGEE